MGGELEIDVWEDYLNSDESPVPDSEQKLRDKLSELRVSHRSELVETGYGQYPRSQYKAAQEAQERLAEQGAEIARPKGYTGNVDPFCCPTPGYVPPTIKRSGCGLLALIIPILLILSQVVV